MVEYEEDNKWKGRFQLLAVLSCVLLIAFVAFVAFGKGGLSESAAQAKIVDKLSQLDMNAKIDSIKSGPSTYSLVLDIDGQKVPVFATRDASILFIQTLDFDKAIAEKKAFDAASVLPTDVPKTAKPDVELFVMSHCPYGTQIEKGMLPVVDLLNDKILFQIKFVNYAMHGEKEVREEMLQYCMQKSDQTKYLQYLDCFLKSGDSTKCGDTSSYKSCVDGTDNQYSVMDNLNNKELWLNGQFPKFLVFDADNKIYGVQGSPTLIINGVESKAGRDSQSLLTAICSSFDVQPEECKQTLSSAAPAPGFGEGASTTGDAGVCG